MPGSDTWQFLGQALGANPTPMAFNEVYLGLQTGTIDGQDNPLPTVRAAKFYEVTEQIVLTSHLVDSLFFAIAQAVLRQPDPGPADPGRGTPPARRSSSTTRTCCSRSRTTSTSSRSRASRSPRPTSRRSAQRVQQMYLESEFSKDWPAGLLDRINATQAP